MKWAMVLAVAGLSAACGHKKAPAPVDTRPRTAADSAETDATYLGKEVYHLLDLASDYRGSHRGRLPRSLRDLGTDSLTHDLARSIDASGSTFSAQAAFRNPAGHHWASCRGDLKVLEDAVLGTGRYTLQCASPTGDSAQVQAGGALE